MNLPGRSLAIVLLVSGLAGMPSRPAIAAPAAGAHYPPVVLPHTAQFDMRSSLNGRYYRILVSVPRTPPPPGGWPALYLVDGNAHFPVAVMRHADNMVIVGIGYQTADAIDREARRYDLTPPPSPDWKAPTHLAGPAGSVYGGQEEFIAFIRDSVKHRIQDEFPVDPGRSALFGMGLGGTFVLHVLATQPDLFPAYIVASPAATWQNAYLLQEADAFAHGGCASGRRMSLFIGLGGLGDAPAADRDNGPPDNANAVARAFGERMAAGSACTVDVTIKTYEDEAHNTISPSVIDRIARFLRAQWTPSASQHSY